MDEFPEFPRAVLETLRQPIETGEVMVARANAHIRYPCRFMLIAAANPCKCGYLTDPARACARAPVCGEDYLGRISGPLMDRFDLRVEVPPVAFTDLDLPPSGESSATVAARVARPARVQDVALRGPPQRPRERRSGRRVLEETATPDAEGKALLSRVAERFGLSARGYHRVLRVARTIADLDGVRHRAPAPCRRGDQLPADRQDQLSRQAVPHEARDFAAVPPPPPAARSKIGQTCGASGQS